MPHRPFMLGLAGDSGAGKTTISTGIARLMGQERTTNICVDDYHKYDRKQRAERNITPLNPACNHMDILEQHVRLLAMGEPILKPVYNHSTGTFDPPVYVPPPRAVSDGNRMIPRVVVLEGLLTFFSPAVRERYHLKVYVDPEEELRREWKIKRDVAKRGYTPEQVVADIERRMPDSQAYIWPQKEHADIVVRFYRPPGYDPERPGTLSVRIKLKHSLPGSISRKCCTRPTRMSPPYCASRPARRRISWISLGASARKRRRCLSASSGSSWAPTRSTSTPS